VDPLHYLLALEQFGIKFGLDNIRTLCSRLDHPERRFRSVHVAGTNGKGSVTAMIDAALRAAGHRSARFTSPHLQDLTERFVIGGQPVDRELLSSTVGRLRSVIDSLIAGGSLAGPPTFFEVTTVVAFELFARAAVDVAVIEVGLGGRLDATNVLMPAVAAITSIAIDHQQYLGTTLRDVAREKAGIIKPGLPVVVGAMAPEALAEIEHAAHAESALVIRAGDGATMEPVAQDAGAAGRNLPPSRYVLRTPARAYGEVRLSLRGAHQGANALVAVRVLETLHARGVAVPAEAVVAGLAAVEWPGRLDLRVLPDGREILLDAAHNPAGAAALASYLEQWDKERRPLVFAAMGDKDIDGMLRALAPSVNAVIVTRPSSPRSAHPDALAARARVVAPDVPVTIAATPAAALAAAWAMSPRIVAAGSIFLLGEVLTEIDAATRRPIEP
jgi:dihydrofolate synthase/folylpolyglutamate synthase